MVYAVPCGYLYPFSSEIMYMVLLIDHMFKSAEEVMLFMSWSRYDPSEGQFADLVLWETYHI